MSARDRPILFSAPMVRAILEGRKTQTRRVVKLPHENPLGHWEPFLFGGQGCRDSKGREISGQMTISHTRTGEVIGCPYGQPGDRLWVRETWATQRGRLPGDGVTFYRADGERTGKQGTFSYVEREQRWRPSIHMPRWASRIDLEVTGVRVERMQDISSQDAWAEGVEHSPDVDPRHQFRGLWESINGPDSWTANPWVWVVEFRRIKP